MRAWLVLLAGLGACDKPQVTADSGRVVAESAATRSASQPATRPECPATGRWAECSVFERLDRAGLAPRRDSAAATEEPLTVRGSLLKVGNSELELFVYADAAARERDEARLDKSKYLEYPAPLTMKHEPTLIRSVNLIAILRSRNEHQRERVSDAITAGPPQPQRQ